MLFKLREVVRPLEVIEGVAGGGVERVGGRFVLQRGVCRRGSVGGYVAAVAVGSGGGGGGVGGGGITMETCHEVFQILLCFALLCFCLSDWCAISEGLYGYGSYIVWVWFLMNLFIFISFLKRHHCWLHVSRNASLL